MKNQIVNRHIYNNMVNLNILLPEGFLNEEIRNGYKIPHEMKKVWAVELDLLAEFDRVCKKHGIKYIASGGTMLGAARHKGFIPWDDDVDLMMMRDEYEKLCEIAPTEFKHPYFFQTEDTDPGFMRYFARLRNSETTGIQAFEAGYNYKYNQGIFIDIFPMDAVIDDKKLFERQYQDMIAIKKKIFKACCWGHHLPYTNTIGYRIKRYLILPLFGQLLEKYFNVNKLFHLYMDVCKRFNKEKTEYISLLSFEFEEKRHYIMRRDMEDIIEVDFEFMKIPTIANYDEALRWKYGDYTKPVKEQNYHGDIIFDTNTSYIEYYKTHHFEPIDINIFYKMEERKS